MGFAWREMEKRDKRKKTKEQADGAEKVYTMLEFILEHILHRSCT